MSPYRDILRLPRAVWLLAAVVFVNRVGTMALPFLAVFLTEARGMSSSGAGLLLAVYGAGGIVAAPFAGRLSDRYGAGRAVVLSLLASGAILALYPLARTPTTLGLATFAWSIATETGRPATMSLIGAHAGPADRKSAFVLARLAVNLGMSAGPAVGGLLASRWFPALFLIDGATSIAAACVFVAAFAGRFAPAGGREDARSPDAGPRARRRAHADPTFLPFLFAAFLAALVWIQTEGAMPLDVVHGMGVPLPLFGLTFTLNTVLILAFELPLNAATAAWPHRRSLALGAALYAVGFGVLGAARSLVGVVTMVVVTTFGEMILMPAMSAYVSDVAPAEQAGEYMGLFMGVTAAGLLAGPWAGLALLDRLGPSWFWGTVFVCGALCAAAMLAVSDPASRATLTPEKPACQPSPNA